MAQSAQIPLLDQVAWVDQRGMELRLNEDRVDKKTERLLGLKEEVKKAVDHVTTEKNNIIKREQALAAEFDRLAAEKEDFARRQKLESDRLASEKEKFAKTQKAFAAAQEQLAHSKQTLTDREDVIVKKEETAKSHEDKMKKQLAEIQAEKQKLDAEKKRFEERVKKVTTNVMEKVEGALGDMKKAHEKEMAAVQRLLKGKQQEYNVKGSELREDLVEFKKYVKNLADPNVD